MKLKIPPLAFCMLSSLLFCGCSGQILEYSAVSTPKFDIKHTEGIDLMTISGGTIHSALIVRCISINKIGSELDILIYLRLTRMDRRETGDFSYTFEIPRDVNKVYFGKKKMQVWSRPQVNDEK